MVVGEVAAYAAYVNRVFAGYKQRHRVLLLGRIVDNDNALCLGKCLAGLFGRDGACCFDPHGLAMGAHYRNTHAHCADAQRRFVHDFARFVKHFHFFLGVAVVLEHIDVWYDIVGKLVGKFLHNRFASCCKVGILLDEFVHCGSSCAAGGLVCCHMHTSYFSKVIDWFQCHHHLYGSAIGVGDDVAWGVEGIVAVDFRYNQWHVVVHAECAGIVYHQCAMLGDGVGKFARSSGTSRCECNIHALEVVVVLEFTHLDVGAFKRIFAASTAA